MAILKIRQEDGSVQEILAIRGADGKTPEDVITYNKQTLTEEQKAQARKNIGVDCVLISILEADPADPKEGQMWILKTATTQSDIFVLAGYNIGQMDNAHGVAISPYHSRAVTVSKTGKQIVPPTIDGVNYCLVEVPATATSCTVVCEGFMWGYNGWNTGADGKMKYDIDSGWKASGVSYTFQAGAAEYVSISFKKGTAGTETITAEDVKGISITFA